jgi:hypothetical protein
LDWASLDARIQQADQAAANKRLAQAMQLYGALIHEVMEDVRKLRRQRASDSTLNL